MIAKNDPFICEVCHYTVPPAQGTFRNHCPQCLTSKHVDGPVPGDRAATCRGLMPAITIEGTNPNQLDLVQECERCGHTKRNRTAPDDWWREKYPYLT